MHTALCPSALARAIAGNSNDAKMAMIAMTTSNSMRVNPAAGEAREVEPALLIRKEERAVIELWSAVFKAATVLRRALRMSRVPAASGYLDFLFVLRRKANTRSLAAACAGPSIDG
jgi:hypothetical protein